MPRMHSAPAKPIDAGESRPSVPRAVADPPSSPSTHQQHLRDVLRREARLRREGREGRQGRHRRPRRVRGPRLGTLTLTTTLLSDPGSPRAPESRPRARRERAKRKATRGPRGQSCRRLRAARVGARPRRSRPARHRRSRRLLLRRSSELAVANERPRVKSRKSAKRFSARAADEADDATLTSPPVPSPLLSVRAVRRRRHLRRVPGPDVPPGEGHRPRQHLPRG